MTLTETEMVDILEEIARSGSNAAARIAAIKALREMRNDEPQETAFDGLYDTIVKRKAA